MLGETMKYLLTLAAVIGLGGAADQISLDEALNQLNAQIDSICKCQKKLLPENFKADIRKRFYENSINNKIEVRKVRELTDEIITTLLFKSTSKSNKLPIDLQNLGNIYYLRLNEQSDGWSCGYWSGFNAEAVNHILAYNIPFNAQNIETRALSHWVTIENRRRLNSREIADHFKHALDVPNLYILQEDVQGDQYEEIDRGKTGGGEQAKEKGGKKEQKDDLKMIESLLHEVDQEIDYGSIWPSNLIPMVYNAADFTRASAVRRAQSRYNFFRWRKSDLDKIIDSNQSGAVHFVCNLNAYHWILISIIKIKDLPVPFMAVLDSANFTIKPGSRSRRYIQLLHRIFIRPYLNGQMRHESKRSPTVKRNGQLLDEQEEEKEMSPRLVINKRCASCNKENCASMCSRCRSVYYCSANCQKRHWKNHKHDCKSHLGLD